MVETRSQKKKSDINIENAIIKKRKQIKDISDSESDNDSENDSEIDEDGNLKDFIDDSDLKKKIKKIIIYDINNLNEDNEDDEYDTDGTYDPDDSDDSDVALEEDDIMDIDNIYKYSKDENNYVKTLTDEEKEYIDKISQTSDEFYAELMSNPIHPKTSQPPTGDFISKYENLSTHYKSIISIHIPAKLSGTLQSAKNAIKRLENKKIIHIDSLSASVGLGLIVKGAAKYANEVNNHDKVINKIESLIKNTEIFLTVNDISYAIKGGRVPKYKGIIAKLLKMHPILSTDDEGKLKAASALFGAKNLHLKFAQFILKKLDQNSHYNISIGHSNAEDQGHEIVDIIENNFKNIISIDLVEMGSALGVHSGPNSFVAGIQKEIDE